MGRGRPNVESRGLAHLEATQDLFVSGNLTVSGSTTLVGLELSGSQTITGSLDVTDDVVIAGNLTVFGEQTAVSSSNLLVDDPLIVVALSQALVPPAYDSGLIHERGTAENVGFIWDESSDEFALIRTSETGSTAGNVSIDGYRDIRVANLLATTGALLPQVNDAASPTLAFGDGDTGFYETSDDTLRLSIDGTGRWQWTSTVFNGTLGAGAPSLVNEIATDTNPVITFSADNDTGVGRANADALSLIAGGIEVLRLSSSLESIFSGNLKIPLNARFIMGDDDDTYIESIIDDRIRFVVSSNNRLEVQLGQIVASTQFVLSAANTRVYNSVEALSLGTVADTNRSLTSGDVIVGSDLEVHGTSYFDHLVEVSSSIASNQGHLILSSSAGSQVSVSGALKVVESNLEVLGTPGSQGGYILRASNDARDLVRVYEGSTAEGRIDVRSSSGANIELRSLEDNFIRPATGEVHISGAITFVSGNLGLQQADGALSPTIQFGDGDSGFYEISDDRIRLTLGGTARIDYETSGFSFIQGTRRLECRNIEGTTTVPNIRPAKVDGDTGFSSAADDQLNMIAGGLEGIRITEDGTSARVAITGSVRDLTGDPSDPVEGEFQINNFDKAFKIYASGSWRTIITW